MPDDALTGGSAEQVTPETAPPAADPAQTAEGGRTEEADFSPDALPAKERARLLKWADGYSAEAHRKKLGEAGSSVARVKPQTRQRLSEQPSLVEDLEAENEALRRALRGGSVGPVGGAVQETKQEEKDDIERDVRGMLESQGYKPGDEGYDNLLRYEVKRLNLAEERLARKQKASPPPDEEVLLKKLSARQFEQTVAAQFEEIKASPEWNHPEKGAEFEGRLRRKIEQRLAEGKPAMPAKLADEVRAEMYPSKTPARGKVSMGDNSSGKVTTTVNSDPWAAFNAEMRAKGKDPDKDDF